MQDGTAKISIFWVNMLKHHYPKLIEHEQLGQAHSGISFDRSKLIWDPKNKRNMAIDLVLLEMGHIQV